MFEGVYLFDVLIPLLGTFGCIFLFVAVLDMDNETISRKIKFGGLIITIILMFILLVGYNVWFENTDDIERDSHILYPFGDGNYVIYNVYDNNYMYKSVDEYGNLKIYERWGGRGGVDINYNGNGVAYYTRFYKVIFMDSIFEDRKLENSVEFNIPDGTYKTIDGVDIYE